MEKGDRVFFFCAMVAWATSRKTSDAIWLAMAVIAEEVAGGVGSLAGRWGLDASCSVAEVRKVGWALYLFRLVAPGRCSSVRIGEGDWPSFSES